jgi:hypothetical protein
MMEEKRKKGNKAMKIFIMMLVLSFGFGGIYLFGYFSHKPKTEKFIVEVPYELKQKDVEEIIADRNPRVDPEIRPIIARTVLNECKLAAVDPVIPIGQMDVESGFNPFCVGKQGEIGLMQLKPSAQIDAIKAEGLKMYEVFYIKNNIHLGVKYYKEQLKRFNGNVALALSGYNAGPNATAKLRDCPNYQAENYVRHVLASYAQIKNTYK